MKNNFMLILTIVISIWLPLSFHRVSPVYGISKETLASTISLTVKNEPLGSVCEKISKLTGYNILVDSRWTNLPVSLSAENQPVIQALHDLLRPQNFAIISNEENKKITLWLVDPSLIKITHDKNKKMEIHPDFPPPDLSAPKSLKELREQYKAENIEVLPPSNQGEKGVSLAEIEKIIKKNQQTLDRMNPSEIEVFPPDKMGKERGATAEKIATVLKQRKGLETSLDEIEIPPPDQAGGPGVSLLEMQKYIDRNKKIAEREIDLDAMHPPE